jgi:hypothetical protein
VRSISDLERGLRGTPHHDTVDLLTTALGLSAQERWLFEAAAAGRARSAALSGAEDAQPAQGPPPRRAGRWPPPLVGRGPELALLE